MKIGEILKKYRLNLGLTLSEMSADIEKVLDDSAIVVIGNKAQINKEEDLFDEVFKLY